MKIIDFIPFGKENAISRAELGRLTGADDRSIRAAIKTANRATPATGIAILSSSGARGYWRTDDVHEMEGYLKESSRRARSQYLNDAPIRALVQRMGGEATIHVSEHFRRAVKPTPEMNGQMTFEGDHYGEKII